MEPNLSTELAIKAFDADAALSAALAEFQAGPRDASLAADAARAAGYGLAWFARPSPIAPFQVVLRHKGGAEISADGESITATLAGLLGHPLVAGFADDVLASEPLAVDAQDSELESRAKASLAQLAVDAQDSELESRAKASLAQLAAESLAAATGGAVVAEAVADPEPDACQLLTDEQKAVCVKMITALTTSQQRSFKISFRDAFRVPRDIKAIAPLITQVRHMEFCDRWSMEAYGGVAA
jgi:hypothetical protein